MSQKILCLALLFWVAGQVRAQEFSNPQIRIHTQTLDCKPGKSGVQNHYLGILVENKTQSRLKVSFEKHAYYGDRCSGCKGGAEATVTLELNPGEIKKGACENPERFLRVFVSSKGGSTQKLSRLLFEKVNIEPIP